jgi:hypothetical protein
LDQCLERTFIQVNEPLIPIDDPSSDRITTDSALVYGLLYEQLYVFGRSLADLHGTAGG